MCSSSQNNSPGEHGFAIFVLALILLLFLHAVVLDNGTLADSSDIFKISPWDSVKPADWYGSPGIDGSATYLFHPSDLLARQMIRSRHEFAWNPYNGFGAPWLAAMQASPYYPLKVVEYVLPFWGAANLIRILLLFIAALGGYLLALSLGLGQVPALFVGFSYALSQRLFLVMNLPTFHVETLLPIMLFAVHRMITARSALYAIAAGWIGGFQFLGGFPESSFIFSLISAAFFLFLIILPENRRSWRMHLFRGGIALLLALTLSGFQIAEFIRYLPSTNHAHVNTYGSVVKAPRDLIRLFVPYFFGPPFEPQWYAGLGPSDHVYLSIFCGVTTLLLAFVGLCNRRYWRKSLFFFAVLVAFIGYDFGFPLFRHIGVLPLFQVSSIAWNVFAIPLCFSVLSGFGVQEIAAGEKLWKKACLAVLSCSVAVILLATYVPGGPNDTGAVGQTAELKWFGFAVVGFLAAVAWSHGSRHRWASGWLVLLVLTAELSHVDTKLGFARYKSYAQNPPSLDWFLKNVSSPDRILGLSGVFPADTLMPYRVRDIRCFDALYPRLYVEYVNAIWPGARTNVYTPGNPEWNTYDDRLLDLAAVRYLFSPTELPVSRKSLIDDIVANGHITSFDPRLVNASGAFTIEGDKRRVLFQHPPATVEYDLNVPADAQLLFSIGEEPAAWNAPGEGVLFSVAVKERGKPETTVYSRYYDPKHNEADRKWVEGRADLSAFVGRTVTLVLRTASGRNGGGNNANAWDGWAGLAMGPQKFLEIHADNRVHIYRNDSAVSRVRFVPTARQAPASFTPLDMKNAAFDLRREVFLKDYKGTEQDHCPAEWQSSAAIDTLEDMPDIERFRASVPCGGFLVLADLYDDGWTALVDGHPARVYNANYAFRAVHLEKGRHDIVFTYSPWTLRLGIPIAFAAATASPITMLWLGFARRRMRIAASDIQEPISAASAAGAPARDSGSTRQERKRRRGVRTRR